jgi:hypothetical protein
MASKRTHPHHLPTDFGHDVALFPTWSTDHAAAVSARSPRQRATGTWTGLRRHVIRRVVVLQVVGRLADLAEDLDREIQLALATEPRGVVCDLSDELDGNRAVEALAAAGRHVRDWPGVPVAAACLDPMVRVALRKHPLGCHLIVAESQLTALTGVLATPDLAARQLRLPSHPSTPRVSREFIAGTLLDWGLSRLTPFASLVVNELVASSANQAGSDIDISVVWDRAAERWDLGILRMTVRDRGPKDAAPTNQVLELEGRRRTVVAGTSRAFGVLPTADGGRTVWAVLEAPMPRPSAAPAGRKRSRNT